MQTHAQVALQGEFDELEDLVQERAVAQRLSRLHDPHDDGVDLGQIAKIVYNPDLYTNYHVFQPELPRFAAFFRGKTW